MMRELSRISGRRSASSSSVGSDNQSTTSSFDPSNEAFNSTRELDDALPRIETPPLEPSLPKIYTPFEVNTAAIRRVFPEFGHGSVNSSPESTASLSVELGRGQPQQPFDEPSIFEDSMAFSAVDVHEIAPPISRKEHRRVMKSMGVTQNKPSDSAMKDTDYGSAGSRLSSTENARGLADFHARVSKDDDDTKASNDRPSTLNITSRSSRFASNKPSTRSNPAAHPAVTVSSKDFSTQLPTHNTVTEEQSFALPNMTNISELISGVFEDGTSRFSAAGRKSRLGHLVVSGLSVPNEEQQIFVSLQLLQERVSELEATTTQRQATIDNLERVIATKDGRIVELETRLKLSQRRIDQLTAANKEARAKNTRPVAIHPNLPTVTDEELRATNFQPTSTSTVANTENAARDAQTVSSEPPDEEPKANKFHTMSSSAVPHKQLTANNPQPIGPRLTSRSGINIVEEDPEFSQSMTDIVSCMHWFFLFVLISFNRLMLNQALTALKIH